jgi:hypothetical protein
MRGFSKIHATLCAAPAWHDCCKSLLPDQFRRSAMKILVLLLVMTGASQLLACRPLAIGAAGAAVGVAAERERQEDKEEERERNRDRN